jgi:hypothetical protein
VLDNLGNWTGDVSSAGLTRREDTDGDGNPDTVETIDHAVNLRNELGEVTIDSTPQAVINDAKSYRQKSLMAS